MRLVLTGDWHLTDTTPVRRVDDYTTAMFSKLNQIGDIASEYGCSYILQPGDFFDACRGSEELKTEFIKISECWRNQGIGVLTIPGQHDMRHRDPDLTNTSLGVLGASKAVILLPFAGGGAQICVSNETKQTVKIFGCPFGAVAQ